MEIPIWKERCEKEATRDVVFLLQTYSYSIFFPPQGFELDSDAESWVDRQGKEWSAKEIFDRRHELYPDNIGVALIKTPRLVFLSREEAEEWVQVRWYNYTQGYEIYGLPCEGQLVSLLLNS